MAEIVDTNKRPRRFLRRVLSWAMVVGITLAMLIPLLHVLIRPIPPGQEPPNVHLGQPCWFCHFVTDHADPVEVD